MGLLGEEDIIPQVSIWRFPVGFSLINHHFWGTAIDGTPHMFPYVSSCLSIESNDLRPVVTSHITEEAPTPKRVEAVAETARLWPVELVSNGGMG